MSRLKKLAVVLAVLRSAGEEFQSGVGGCRGYECAKQEFANVLIRGTRMGGGTQAGFAIE